MHFEYCVYHSKHNNYRVDINMIHQLLWYNKNMSSRSYYILFLKVCDRATPGHFISVISPYEVFSWHVCKICTFLYRRIRNLKTIKVIEKL